MIGAEVEHGGTKPNEREPQPPPAWAAPLRGYPADSSGPGYRHSAALDRSRRKLLDRRTRVLGLAEAVAAEHEDLGVLDEPVGDCRGDGRIEENVAPVGERCVGGYDCGTSLAVAGGDNLIEEVRRLLVEGQISKFVTDQQRGLGIGLELADEGMIDLGGEQVIEHVHGTGASGKSIKERPQPLQV